MRIYQMFRAFIYCNTTQSKCHKTWMFIFISYSAHSSGVRAESGEANSCCGRLLHYDFYVKVAVLALKCDR